MTVTVQPLRIFTNGVALRTPCTNPHQLIIIHHRLMAIFSKISSAHQVVSKGNTAADQGQTPTTPAPSTPGRPSLPPSLTTSALADTTAGDAHLSEARLRRLALESLVDVLRSLVAWGIVAPQSHQNADLEAAASNSQLQSRTSIHEDPGQQLDASDSMLDRLSPVAGGSIDLRRNTSDLAIAVDDPSRFESAKQRKTVLLEGIRKFNFKPKRVSDVKLGLKVYGLIFISRAFNRSLMRALLRAPNPRILLRSFCTLRASTRLLLESTWERGKLSGLNKIRRDTHPRIVMTLISPSCMHLSISLTLRTFRLSTLFGYSCNLSGYPVRHKRLIASC